MRKCPLFATREVAAHSATRFCYSEQEEDVVALLVAARL